MAHAEFLLTAGLPKIVGSFGGTGDLEAADPSIIRRICDIAEVRLDLIINGSGGAETSRWRHLEGVPLLFTVRRIEEGGALALNATERMAVLEGVLDDAACIDIEAASIVEMRTLVKTLESRGIPWIASFHDFEKFPETSTLEDAAKRALDAGAHAFKAAALLHRPADIARLAEFQLADHGIPVATMGMGPLAPVSRLLCAQCGSVLNYGYLGETPTAPGQWDAALLKQAIARLAPFRA
jgi:3-dehydroquinate dehydratase I